MERHEQIKKTDFTALVLSFAKPLIDDCLIFFIPKS